MNEKYEAVIGLEVHAELKTGTKIFCSCSTQFGAQPNTNVCPTCFGMPGTLPVLNKNVVMLAIRAGLSLGCRISRTSWFDRKNYFYPDLPKGYQITQYEMPICLGGEVPIEVDGVKKGVRLTRIHMEEDAGKLIHRGDESLIDFNRAGVPLIEIVSEPDMRSADEAKAYLNSLRRILRYYGISDCRMNEGSLRCDVNVSVREKGSDAFGVKCEIKNLNSVNYVGKAVEDEIKRQIALIESGGEVEAETRRFNENTGHTERMRKKETVVDYRYFTEPNLPPLVLTEDDIDAVRGEMPVLPDEAAAMLGEKYGVKAEDAYFLSSSPELTDYYVQCAESTEYKSQCTNLFVSEILPSWLSEDREGGEKVVIEPEFMGEICALFGEGKIVSSNAKRLIAMCAENKKSPRCVAEEEKMLKIADPEVLRTMAQSAIDANPKAVSDYRGGKKTAVRQLVGAVMKLSAGRADPVLSEQILTELLEN